jgi:hypothetical protein
VTAQYTDDANYTGSTSSAITVTVAPDFSAAFDSSTITIANPGLSGTANLTITGQTGYNGTVSLTAAACLGLPFGASCSFAPASVTGSGTSKLTVGTVAPHLAAPSGPAALNLGLTAGGVAFAGIFLLGSRPRRRRSTAVMGVLLPASLLTLAGCSGGGGGGGTPGTPPGSYSITVTAASQQFSHPLSFTLVVN